MRDDEFYKQMLVEGVKEHNVRVAAILSGKIHVCKGGTTNTFLDHLVELGAIEVLEKNGDRFYRNISLD